jgi:hypothetical protein
MSDYISATGSGTTVTYTKQNGDQDIYSGGTPAWRNNNPGNMIPNRFSYSHGAIGEVQNRGGKRAIFPDRETGEKALRALLSGPSYSDRSLDKAIARFAPAKDGNNTPHYQAYARRHVGTSGDTLIRNLTSKQMDALFQTIETMEGSKPGTITHKPAQRVHGSIGNNDLEQSAPGIPSNREPSAQQNSSQSGFSTGDPDLDRLAAALSPNDESAISQVSAQIAQSPSVQAMAQQGRDLLTAQQVEEQRQEEMMRQSQGPSLSR